MPNRAFRPVAFLVTAIVCAPLALLLAWPQAYGAQTALVIAQLLAFRALLAIILGAIAIGALAVALVRRRWAIAAAIAVMIGAASAFNGAILLSRGASSMTPPGDLTVVAWNTLRGGASPESIARLVKETDADIVSLPETDARAAGEVARLLAAEGRIMLSDTAYGETGDSWIPTSVLIAEDLGDYRLDASAGSTPGLPSGVWRSADGSGPTIVAAHPRPPIPRAMDEWRSGLMWIADQCDAPDVIVAGDLNATVDHLSGFGVAGALVGECDDAATEAGSAAMGTWPTSAPTWLATPIDRVLVGSAWNVRGMRIVTAFDDAGSDHRPIVVVLERN